jgi:hypothetical protein
VTIVQPQAVRPAAAKSAKRWGAVLPPVAIAAAGFGLTVIFLYPGYLTNDATFVHSYTQDWHLGDWQSPVMTLLWWLIDPIAPGSASMFLFTTALYWLGFGLTAAAVARRSPRAALAVPLIALTPAGFFLLAMIWRDILFAPTWLVAAAMVYLAVARPARLLFAVKMLAAALVGFGILLRPNAIVAAPLLLAYIIRPAGFEWKRAALIFVPAVVAGYGLIHLVYYELLDVKRENPLHSLLVFDLGGITHFSGENQFPVSWTAQESALLTSQCYEPKLWDSYWTLDPCRFVMARLERPDDVIFGTPRLVEAWIRAATAHPLAYLEHRLTFTWTFLARDKIVLELFSFDQSPLAQNHAFLALKPLYDALRPTILFRVGLWLFISVAIIALAWPGRSTADGAFAIGAVASGICYVLSFTVLGVSSDFRYAYWDVLACFAGLVPALLARRAVRAARLSAQAYA